MRPALIALLAAGTAIVPLAAHAQGLLQSLGQATGVSNLSSQFGLSGPPGPTIEAASAQRFTAALEGHGVPSSTAETAVVALGQSLASGHGRVIFVNGTGTDIRVGPIVHGNCREGGVAFSQNRAYAVTAEGGWCYQGGSWVALQGHITGTMVATAKPVRPAVPAPVPAAHEKAKVLPEAPASGAPFVRYIEAKRMEPMRAKPDDTSEKEGYVHPGQQMKVVDEVPGYFKIILSGIPGYVPTLVLLPPDPVPAKAPPAVVLSPNPLSSSPAAVPVQPLEGGVGKEGSQPAAIPPAPVTSPQVKSSPVPQPPPVAVVQPAPVSPPAPTTVPAAAPTQTKEPVASPVPAPTPPPPPPPKAKVNSDL